MKKTEDYINEILKLRSDNRIDPFNFGLLKYTSWEVSLQARLKEDAQYLTPRVVEIVSSVLNDYMDEEDITEIAELQMKLTKKYSDNLEQMDSEINSRVEAHVERYNEAVRRVMENEKNEQQGDDEERNN